MHSSLGALVGPPNAGKTTLYNWMTGSKFSTVNYPGSTVEYATGHTLEVYGESIDAIDTPGIYSLSPKSPEEVVTVNALFGDRAPHVVAAVVDATQLSRHLYLVKQLQESGFKVVVALTMTDLVKKKNQKIDIAKLSKELGAPVVEIDGRLGGGVKELVSIMRNQMNGIPKSRPIEQWPNEKIEQVQKAMSRLADSVLLDHSPEKMKFDQTTSKIDKVLLHPIWGLVTFVLIMGGLFSSIYWLAAPMMDLVDSLFGSMAEWVAIQSGNGLLANFLSKGVVAGLGSVLVFVPQIFILFLGMVILEDWGYLARAATIIDRPLTALGLNGRAFVPLLSGYACAIPAMMAARTINSRRERLLTIFVVPLMSCSARLPVYALLLAYLFQGRPAWQPGLALLGLYLTSMIVGALAATIASRFYQMDEKSWFMLELPLYRRPVIYHVLRNAFRRTGSYVRKAGPTILVLSLVIWAGTTFPNYENKDEAQRLSTSYAATAGRTIEPLMEPMGADWRVGVSLIAAFAAREVFVSALALIFNVTADENEIASGIDEDESLQNSLLKSMKVSTNSNGEPLFTPASVLALIVFFMIALQCLSTVAVAKKETGSTKFVLFQLVAFTVAAYVAAVVVYQFVRLVA